LEGGVSRFLRESKPEEEEWENYSPAEEWAF
jgi:hypothetical protein